MLANPLNITKKITFYMSVDPSGAQNCSMCGWGISDLQMKRLKDSYIAFAYADGGELVYSKGDNTLGHFFLQVMDDELIMPNNLMDRKVTMAMLSTPRIIELENEIGDLELLKKYFLEKEITTPEKITAAFSIPEYSKHRETLKSLKEKQAQ